MPSKLTNVFPYQVEMEDAPDTTEDEKKASDLSKEVEEKSGDDAKDGEKKAEEVEEVSDVILFCV